MTDIADVEQLWHSHHAKIIAYISKRTDADTAEDIAQTVYLKACEAICSGKGYNSNASRWLYRIAHNLVIDLYRARQSGGNYIELDAPADMGGNEQGRTNGDMLPDDGYTPHELAEKTILCQTIRACLGTLPPDQMLVITKRMEGYEFAELGIYLGRKYEATKALQTRGYQQMRLMLDKEGNAKFPKAISEHTTSIVSSILQKHGPLSISLLMHYTDLPYSTVHYTLNKHAEFERVNLHTGGYLWDLASKQEAA